MKSLKTVKSIFLGKYLFSREIGRQTVISEAIPFSWYVYCSDSVQKLEFEILMPVGGSGHFTADPDRGISLQCGRVLQI